MNFDFKQQNVGETMYLVLDIDDDLEIDSFAMSMMAYNRISNVVQTQLVRINETRQLQFDITGLIKINTRVTVPRSKKEVLDMLNGIVNSFEEVEAYMLDTIHLLLDWEYVYLDEQGNCVLIYLPFHYDSGKDKIVFLQEVVSRIQLDYQERDPYLFDILNAFSRGAIRRLSDFREIIRKNAYLTQDENKEGKEEKEIKKEVPLQKQEIPVSKFREKEDQVISPDVGKAPNAKSAGGSKIPVINIPGREPGTKEKRQESPQMPEKKKGFFMKEAGKNTFNKEKSKKQSHFAIPKKKKSEEMRIPDKEDNELPDNRKIYLNNSKEDMYEGYEDTVIIQEPVMIHNKSERTVMLEQQEASMTISAKLIRKQDGASYLIDRERVIIGSGTTADICIHNNTISRNHAIIVFVNENFYIEDNQSRNGSFINGKRLLAGKREKLDHKAVLRFSNEDFEFSTE